MIMIIVNDYHDFILIFMFGTVLVFLYFYDQDNHFMTHVHMLNIVENCKTC